MSTTPSLNVAVHRTFATTRTPPTTAIAATCNPSVHVDVARENSVSSPSSMLHPQLHFHSLYITSRRNAASFTSFVWLSITHRHPSTDARTRARTDGRTNERTDARSHARTDGQTKERRDEGRNEGRNEGRHEGTKERRQERRNEGTKERRNEGTKERRNEGTKERTDERTNGRTDERTNGRTDERTNGRTDATRSRSVSECASECEWNGHGVDFECKR